MVLPGANRDSYKLLHRAPAWGILASGLLKFPYPALKVGDQFIAPVNLVDHLADPHIGVGQLALDFGKSRFVLHGLLKG
jgi:hypothetical protein